MSQPSIKPAVGVIGGSGLYAMDGLEGVEELQIETPFGPTSAPIVRGQLPEVPGQDLLFLARHGRGHVLNPSEVPYRANIWALKKLGVGWIISVSAVGSLREEVAPGQVVLVDQFIDRTKERPSTFFEKGLVAHVGFADPTCDALRTMLHEASRSVGAVVHPGGTYVCMEGPAFSTRAESHLYRSWGAKVIGMTNLPEAKLAREAEISYATLAMATDYDCWHTAHDAVTVDQVIAVLQANVGLARRIIRAAVPAIAAFAGVPPHADALRNALITDRSRVSPERVRELWPIVGRYFPDLHA